MATTRLFVGNLPSDVSETKLQDEFNAYGNVQKVEVKTKENLVDPSSTSYFAFVTIKANQQQIQQCIQEFQDEQFCGRYLKVSVARESFLDRLKRERDESTSTPAEPARVQNSSNPFSDHAAEKNQKNNVKKFSENDPFENEEFEELIAKKRASNSLQNGKVKIKTYDNAEPIHIIHKKKEFNQNLDDRGKESDKKRKESMFKMKDQYKKQKSAIQQALSATDVGNKRKIRFDENIEFEEKYNSIPAQKMSLFNDDADMDNKYENDFNVKKQFEGKKGQKLMELQSKFKLDSRFQMDEKFMDDTEEEIDEEIDDERKWQLGILEQVVGHKINSDKKLKKKKHLENTMQRYDPTKKDHEKYLRTNDDDNVIQKIKNDTKVPKENTNEAESFVVSKDQFFTINADLKESFKRRGDGFSLLSMFGRQDDQPKSSLGLNNNEEERILISRKSNKKNTSFNFVSSESEGEEFDESKVIIKENRNELTTTKSNKTTVNGVWTEHFFFNVDDERFLDGTEFFKAVQKNEHTKDYDEVKMKLKNIINRKINKTKLNMGIKTKNSKKSRKLLKK